MKNKNKFKLKEYIVMGIGVLFIALACVAFWGGLYVEIDSDKACYVNDEPVDNELECKINTNAINLSVGTTRTIIGSMYGISGIMLLAMVALCHNSSKK